MDIPDDRRYTDAHEWVQVVSTEADGTRVRLGISDYAQDALGDIVYVDLPAEGRVVAVGDTIAEVESTKSVGEVYAPVAGTVVSVNTALGDEPELVNADPYGAGWVAELVMDDPSSFDGLLDAVAYRALID